MRSKKEFNSKKELDKIIHIVQNEIPRPVPSEVIKFYSKVEDFIINIYEMGYTEGVQLKEEIENNLKSNI